MRDEPWVRPEIRCVAEVQERFTDEIHWLPTETLRGEWDALCKDLSRFVDLRDAQADLRPGGLAYIHVAGAEDHLRAIDQRMMACLAAEPLHRRDLGNDELEITLQFRHWWRESVPFLIDPDGDLDRYVYERLDAGGPPPPIEP